MTIEEITELFIKAAEVDRKLPDTARPKGVKSMSLGYVHDVADINGWASEDKEAARWTWLDPKNLRNTRNDMGLWEAAMVAIKLVDRPESRRSLWAWATATAGGMTIAKWARTVEHIHPETVSRRAKASITEIHHKLCSTLSLHNQNDMNSVLPDTPEITDKRPTIRAWRDDEAANQIPCYFDQHIAGISVRKLELAKRRERDAKRRQSEAA